MSTGSAPHINGRLSGRSTSAARRETHVPSRTSVPCRVPTASRCPEPAPTASSLRRALRTAWMALPPCSSSSCVLAVAFDYVNGFHDTANAIATSVATRALSPGWAILMAAAFNFIGAFAGTAVATTIGSGLVNDADDDPGDRRRGAHRRDHLEPHHLAGRACRARAATRSSAACSARRSSASASAPSTRRDRQQGPRSRW